MRRYLSAAVFLGCAAPVDAAASDALEWDQRWEPVSTGENVLTVGLLAGTAAGFFVLPQRKDKWTGGILLDDAVRKRVVLGDHGHREAAVIMGDIFYYGLTTYPVLVDVGIAAIAVHQSPEVAWQMVAIDAQAFAITGFVSVYTQKLVGRNRPMADRCAQNPDYDPDCDDPENRSQSFISGHVAMAFTGAGLICVHHAHLPLYGSRAADMLACSVGMLGASTVAVSRLTADRHYLSDVAAGAGVGVASGYLLPELLHYGFTPAFHSDTVSAMVLPEATPESAGLRITGTF